MKNSLPFARFINLLKALEGLHIPYETFHQHRVQYHYILSQLCLAEAANRKLSIADLLNCPILGSQPTAHKRIKELIKFNLIAVKVGEDRRQRFLCLTDTGQEHLRKCSQLMMAAFS